MALVLITVCIGMLLWRHSRTIHVLVAPDSFQDAEISFFALGDQGRGNHRQRKVADMMEAVCQQDRDVNFTLLLGDNFYGNGVRSVDDPKWLDQFELTYNAPCLRGMPFYAALGNHDYIGNPQAQVAYSQKRLGSARWRMPSSFYMQDFGSFNNRILIRLVVLDTNQPIPEQLELIQRAFKNPEDSIWKMAAGHHQIRSFSSKYGDSQQLIDNLLPVLRKYRVDMYLCGHSHNLQLITRAAEPLYVISGAGGARIRKIKNDTTGSLIYRAEQHGFVKIEATPDDLRIQFIKSLKEERQIYTVTRACLRGVNKAKCFNEG
ncbi:MAG: metallophosphoesterase [Desulfobacterales bacterium]|nr:metallophosphoesterase [Desulfobacterales bacterium]